MNIFNWLFSKAPAIETIAVKKVEAISTPPSFEQLLELSKSYNGFEREKALILLQKLQDSRAIPNIVARLNDWVPQVRTAAEAALVSFFTNQNSAVFVQLLVEFENLKKMKRHDHAQLIAKLLNYLTREENSHSLISAVRSSNQKLAFLAFKLCVEFELLNSAQLINLVIETKNLACLRYSISLLDKVDVHDLPAIASKLLKFKTPKLLVKSFEVLSIYDKMAIKEFVPKLHFCKNAELRRLGRAYSEMNQLYFKELYSTALLEPEVSSNKINICLIELANIQKIDALPLIENYFFNEIPSVRKTSLQLVVKLLKDESKVWISRALLDSSVLVKNEASRLSISAGIYFDADELLALYNLLPTLNLMRCIFRLSKRVGKWPRLFLYLDLLERNRSNSEAIGEINIEISHWCNSLNRGSSAISKFDLEKLKSQRENLANLLSPANQKFTDFILATS